jgi:hypothetical protein
MVESVVPRARGRLATQAFLLLAALAGGCGPAGEGSVSAGPKGEGTEVVASKKGASPRVPRGPDAAKVIQESVPKK